MAILVYKLTCAVSGKAYVGITARSLDTRWLEHCQRARHGTRKFSKLYQAMAKHGLDAFFREVIATADNEDEARTMECAYIRQFDTFASGYNANEGGHGWLVVPESVRRKSGEAQRGKVMSAESRSRMSAAKKADSRPQNFGDHTKKGDVNPRAIWFAMSCPDGVLRIGGGLRAFIRDNNLHSSHLNQRGHSKGFHLLDRFYPEAAQSANITKES